MQTGLKYFLVNLLFLVVSRALAQDQENKDGRFVAAVYEHRIIQRMDCTNKLCSREEAISVMEDNLSEYAARAEEAAAMGARIILFPEDGLGNLGSRYTIRPFLEKVPHQADLSNPCFEDIFHLTEDYVKIRLSCMAAEFGIYVAANFGSYLPGCEHCGDDHGPECFFNTLVVFDDEGSLAAVYHKYNLWTGEERKFDIDERPNLVYLDTAFGRLGLVVCADLFWESPTVDLVLEQNIDTLLVPLYWWDLFPHQLSHSNEDAWARGLQVNVLAANIHSPPEWSSGSGLYAPSGAVAYYHNISEDVKGSLQVAELDIRPLKRNTTWWEYAQLNENSYPQLSEDQEFFARIYDDYYKLAPLDGSGHQLKVCSDEDDFCCLLDYQADFHNNDTATYSLGVYSGPHFKDGSVRGMYYIQMCTVLKCNPIAAETTCSQDLSWDYDYLTSSEAAFSVLQMSGTFTTEARVFPEALFHGATLNSDAVAISSDGVLSLTAEMEGSFPVLSFSLFGRVFGWDNPPPHQFCPTPTQA